MDNQKTKEILSLISGIINKEKLVSDLKKIQELLLKREQQLNQFVKKLEDTTQNVNTKLENDSKATIDKTQRLVQAELESLLRRFSGEQEKITKTLSELKDGEDGHTPTQEELTELMTSIFPQETAEQLRDKLETLKGEKEIRITAIEELKKEIEELKKRPLAGRTPYGGSVNHKFMDDKDTLTADGTTKEFTLFKDPINLQLFRAGALQDEGVGNDFVLAGKTVTFKSAPAVGEKLKAFYRYL